MQCFVGDTKVKNPEDLSAETMAKWVFRTFFKKSVMKPCLFLWTYICAISSHRDVGKVVEALYGENPPPIMMIGHSMGGAIAVHAAAANHVPSLLGLCVIDVVEGRFFYPSFAHLYFWRTIQFPSRYLLYISVLMLHKVYSLSCIITFLL